MRDGYRIASTMLRYYTDGKKEREKAKKFIERIMDKESEMVKRRKLGERDFGGGERGG